MYSPCSPPVHIKNVKRLNIERLRSSLAPSWRKIFDDLYRVYTPQSPLLLPGKRFQKYHQCNLTQNDVKRLVENGLIQNIDRDDVRGTVLTFSTMERQKNRRRWIVYPKEQNALLEQIGCREMRLVPINDVILESTFCSCTTLDMEACFHQIELLQCIRPYFCFCHETIWYALATVPTGGINPPGIAQFITEYIAGLHEFHDEIAAPVSSTVHIDNIRHGGTKIDVDNATAETLKRAARIDATVSIEVVAGVGETDIYLWFPRSGVLHRSH